MNTIKKYSNRILSKYLHFFLCVICIAGEYSKKILETDL